MAVRPRARVSLSARRDDGLCGSPRGLCPGEGSQSRTRAGQLLSDRSNRPRRNGRSMARRMLARPAAVKLIRPSLKGDARARVSDAARRRFEREAHAIASLRSPHTIDLFDFGMADDGTVYYVMELLEGLDADALVRST